MRSIVARRLLDVSALIVVCVVLLLLWMVGRVAFLPVDLVTGWMLLAGMLFLAAFGARKRLSVLPLGSASRWLHLHVYVGLLMGLVFLLHTEMRMPRGALEVALASVFVALSVSGVVGLILSRTLPPLLAGFAEEEILMERAPILRRTLRTKAETLVLDAVRETEQTTLCDFYVASVSDFFARSSHFWPHVLPLGRPWENLLLHLDAQSRYLSEREREVAGQLRLLIYRKIDLDRQEALQKTLKFWLFAHVPLTGAALVLAFAHVAIVHWVRGGSV